MLTASQGKKGGSGAPEGGKSLSKGSRSEGTNSSPDKNRKALYEGEERLGGDLLILKPPELGKGRKRTVSSLGWKGNPSEEKVCFVQGASIARKSLKG